MDAEKELQIPLIVVGMTVSELFNCYKISFIAKKAREFWYTRGKNALRCQSTDEVKSALEQLCNKGQKEVEIIGSYTDCCVANAVECALQQGMTVYVPDDKVFESRWERGRCVKELLTAYIYNVKYNYKRIGNMHKFEPKVEK